MLNLREIISKKWLNNIDLLISWIPFRSLPKELFDKMMNEVLPWLITKETIFIQFSYLKNTKILFDEYFNEIKVESCLLNVPKAYIFTCKWFKK